MNSMKRGVIGLIGIVFISFLGMLYFPYITSYATFTGHANILFGLTDLETVKPTITVGAESVNAGETEVLTLNGVFNKNLKVFWVNNKGRQIREASYQICYSKTIKTKSKTSTTGAEDYNRALPKCTLTDGKVEVSTVGFRKGTHLVVGESYGVNQRRFKVTAEIEVV